MRTRRTKPVETVPRHKPARSGRDFTQLMRGVPVDVFVRMVTKSGLPAREARELCQAFKELKS